MSDHNAIFTPRSARSALHDVRPVAERIRRVYRSLERRRDGSGPSVQVDGPVERRYFALVMELNRLLDRLSGMGVLVQDFKRGLVDFPARRDGRPVFLCWQIGEETLDHWHPASGSEVAPPCTSGRGGRRPVDDDGPWEREGDGVALADSDALA
jgi:hypothetical protein